MSENLTAEESIVNIAKIMLPKVSIAHIYANDTVRQGLEIMKHHGYTAVPVLDSKGIYLGSVTEGDFLRHILSTGTTDIREHENYKIKDIFRPNFCQPIRIYASMSELLSVSLEQNYVPIVDDRNCFCGIVTRKSIIKLLAEYRNIK